MASGGGFNVRRLTRRQIALMLSLLVLLVGSVSVTILATRPAEAVVHKRQPAQEHNDPRAAAEYFQMRHYGTTYPATDAYTTALTQAQQLPSYQTHSPTSTTSQSSTGRKGLASLSGDASTNWIPLGPAPIDFSTCTDDGCSGPYGNVTGRITALAVDPTDSDMLWVGTADGGLWRSTDGGAHYTPLSDSWPVMSIGSIAIDPRNHNAVYVGTGEANHNADSYWGEGIFKTTNGTATTPTWTQQGFSSFGGMDIAQLAVDPTNSSTILAAVDVSCGNSSCNTPPGGASSVTSNGGIWRSTNGGTNWTQVLKDSSSVHLDFGTAVLFDPSHSGVAFAGLADPFGYSNGNGYTSQAGVYKSTDHGATWTRVGGGAPINNPVGRVSLALSSDGATLYVTDADSGTSGGISGKLLNGAVYVSTNATNDAGSITFTGHGVPNDMSIGSGSYQYWYDLYTEVDPTNANVAYVGGLDIWKTTNGGSSWTNLTNTSGAAAAGVHPGQHALAFFSSASSSYYAGNDGGLWKNVGGTFTNINDGGLNITQFYGGSYGDVGGAAGTLYGGSQDNGEAQLTGTTFTAPATWNEAFGGDGGYTAVDYTNNHIVYEEQPNGNIYKSTDGGATWNFVASDIDATGSDDMSFIMPFIESPTNHNTLFAGTDRVYKTTNGASSWSAISGKLDTNAADKGWYSAISALAVAPGNDNVIYAGTNSGRFFYTTNGSTWHGTSISGSSGGVLTGIAVDPTNSSIVYATFADFASGAGHHVFKSTNNGGSWTDISKTLPNVPFESVIVNPNYSGLVIVGSDAGVFASTNSGGSWSALGNGLPHVAINQLFASHDGSKLFVATHGRGMWLLSTASLLVSPTTPISATVAVGSGSGTYRKTITVSNHGFAAMNWSASNVPSCLTVSPSSGSLAAGSSQSVTLSMSTATAATSCVGNVTINANGLVTSMVVPFAVEVSNLSKTWYFAEGYTASSFKTYLTLANPNAVAAHVTITYLIQGASSRSKKYTLNPTSRTTILVNTDIGKDKSVSSIVSSDQPIVAERPMYFYYATSNASPKLQIPGGTDLLGMTSLGTDYHFGYLDTTNNHDTFLTVLNNNASSMIATVTYYPANGGTPIVVKHTFAAHTRGTISVWKEVPKGTTYSAEVVLSAPGLVERPMYFKDSTTGRYGAADVGGLASAQTSWYFAEGQADSTHNERLVLSNQGSSTAAVNLNFYGADGGTHSEAVSVAPGKQMIVVVNTDLPTLTQLHGIVITADKPILADRVISQRYTGIVGGSGGSATIDGATDSTGVSRLSQAYYFAEGYTSGSFAEYLELLNPGDAAATVVVSYLPTNSSAPTVRVYTIPAHTRYTIFANDVMKGQSFSMQVLANQPIVAERSLIFVYLTSPSERGADVATGYVPLG